MGRPPPARGPRRTAGSRAGGIGVGPLILWNALSRASRRFRLTNSYVGRMSNVAPTKMKITPQTLSIQRCACISELVWALGPDVGFIVGTILRQVPNWHALQQLVKAFTAR